MSLFSALRAHLIAYEPITTLIGSGDAARIAPVGTKPAHPAVPRITYQRAGADHARHLTGAAGIVERIVDITCWAETQAGAEALADLVRELLHGFGPGPLGSGDEVIDCRGITLDDEDDNIEEPIDAGLVGKHSTTQTYRIWHTETTAP